MKWEDTRQYSPQELETMQKDALERVRQMQRRSEQMLHHTRKTPSFFIEEPHPAPSRPSKDDIPATPPENCTPSQNQSASLPSPSFQSQFVKTEPASHKENGLDALFSTLDRERLLILGLFFLLYSDGADPALLLSLLFLAM